MTKIAPSILTGNMCEIGTTVRMLDTAKTDWIHLDVMDGVFVPNMTFGPKTVKDMRPITSTFLDAHLMVQSPDTLIDDFAEAGADLITIQYESPACLHHDRSLKHIRELGKKAGLALNPGTTDAVLDYLLEDLDLVLVMSVNPGFGGQKFIPSSLRKIEQIAARIQKLGLPIDIEVDGGVKLENARSIVDAGASVLVTGSAVLGSADPIEAVRQFKELTV